MKRAKCFLGIPMILFLSLVVVAQLPQKDQPQANGDRQTKVLGNELLVSVEPLPAMIGPLMALLQPEPLPQSGTGTRTSENLIGRGPIRVIKDPNPTFSDVTVDPIRNEIIVVDENLFQVLVYDRTANTPPTANFTEPKRIIGGSLTKIEFNCGVYVDPETGDIYSIPNDTVDTMVVFDRESQGNVRPTRELAVPHRTFGIAVDESKEEVFLTIESPSALVVYRKTAEGNEAPLRILEGRNTDLEDPHGVALDTENQWLFVSNHGAVSYSREGRNFLRVPQRDGLWVPPSETERRSHMIPGSGESNPPSITIYSLDAEGDAAPLRVIEGPATQFNWPTGLAVDEERGELYVANDGGDSVLVFRTTDSGNAAPIRVIKGPSTGLKNPTGLFADTENQELVVSNMGNHSVTIFPLTAEGDVPPLRTIRGAPEGKVAQIIGNPGGVAYDSKRDQLLVPN